MSPINVTLGALMVLIVFLVPMALVGSGLRRSQSWTSSAFPSHAGPSHAGSPWLALAVSALAYALAYNMVFFVQELGLVLPKAFVPGLDPVLFHNNHTWQGDNPIALLFQASGAVSIFLMALGLAALLSRGFFQSGPVRLLVGWIIFHGVVQSTLQVPSGVFAPDTDFGDTMNYLGWPLPLQAALAVAALLLIPVVAWFLAPRIFGQLGAVSQAKLAPLGWLLGQMMLGTLLAAPFRWPHGLGNLVFSPTIIALIGFLWLSAFYLRGIGAGPICRLDQRHVLAFAAAWIALLIAFQTVLRSGIQF